MDKLKCVNGFESWHETHYQMVCCIEDSRDGYNVVSDTLEHFGSGGLMELAYEWTNEFEELHKGQEWDGEWYDELDKFWEKKFKE